jgi:hypothetical protein
MGIGDESDVYGVYNHLDYLSPIKMHLDAGRLRPAILTLLRCIMVMLRALVGMRKCRRKIPGGV